MRLSRYLNEKYVNTLSIKGFGAGDYEVFVNPTSKERKEVTVASDYRGYRYLLDFKQKKVYIVSSETFHEELMNRTPELPNFNEFWHQGKHHDRIFTGDFSGRHSSDALYAPIYTNQELRELLKQDWNWAKRYIDDFSGLIKMIKYEATG
jgi:hypothetical protein